MHGLIDDRKAEVARRPLRQGQIVTGWWLVPWLIALLAAAIPAQLCAEVRATFYAHELDDRFPHAFVVLQGIDESTGARVDENYGFTATAVTAAILFKSVNGKIESVQPRYIARSTLIFSVALKDKYYRELLGEVIRWRDTPQPSYSLSRANCVHFIGAIARAAGLRTNPGSRNFRRPKAYLLEIRALNAARTISPQ